MVKENLQKDGFDGDEDLATDCEVDIFKALNCDKTATTSEIKTQYRKLALLFHPDKQVGKSAEEVDIAAKKFKEITDYYQVLIDPKRRERYEATGELTESNLDEFDGSAATWKEWFLVLGMASESNIRFDSLYTKITASQIEEYEKIYRYSEQERQDVYMAYTKATGSLLDMIDFVPYATVHDIERFKTIIEISIDLGELQKYKGFPAVSKAKLKKKMKLMEDEAALADEERKRDGLDPEKSLSSLIRSKNKSRAENLLKSLEEKARSKVKGGKGKKRKEPDEPTEEEFAALQSKLFKVGDPSNLSERPARSKKKVGF